MFALRGATQLDRDSAEAMADAVGELCDELLRANALTTCDLVSALFSLTSDLTADFPARIARERGWNDVPMMCAQEVAVPGSLARCCRVMVHVERVSRAGREPPPAPRHVYLRGAAVLRPDLAARAAK